MKKILLVSIIFILCFYTKSIAKYKLNYELNCFEVIIEKEDTISEFEQAEADKNIDIIPPKIIGIENNQIYHEAKHAEYIDNESGIKKVEKTYYGDLLISSNFDDDGSVILNVLRCPKNIIEFKYYRIENGKENYILSNMKKLKFSNLDKVFCEYYVIGIDNNGAQYKSNIVSKDNSLQELTYIKTLKEDNKTFSKSGYYDIEIEDNAGNVTSYTITIDLNY